MYDLDAREVQSVPAPAGPARTAPGRFNNVDLVHSARLGDLAVTTDRGSDRLRVYRIDRDHPGGPLTDATDPKAAPVFSASQDEINEQRTAYGLATWTDPATGRSYALVSQRGAPASPCWALTAPRGRHHRLHEGPHPRPARELPSPERHFMVAVREPARTPAGRGHGGGPGERHAVRGPGGHRHLAAAGRPHQGRPDWSTRVREFGVPGSYDETTEECTPGADPGFGGTHLTADVEGLTLVQEKGGDGLLLASSQGDDTFAAYDREVSDANEYEGGFRVGPASTTLDGSEECDGAAALNSAAGPPLPARPPRRPGRSRRPGDPDRPATSFKFVDLRKVTAAVDD